jgi:hypothetical protein
MPLPPPDRRPAALVGMFVGAVVVGIFGYAFWRAVQEAPDDELDLVDATPDPDPADPPATSADPPAGPERSSQAEAPTEGARAP